MNIGMISGKRRVSLARGFTLVELLIVVAIIGIISSIALPNLFEALQKARQKRTMADIRTLAETVEIYGNDNSFYPKVGDTTADVLVPWITPYIVKVAPERDGWNHLVNYYTNDGINYTLISFGANREQDLPYITGRTSRFKDDIVFSNAAFIQWPEGAQTF